MGSTAEDLHVKQGDNDVKHFTVLSRRHPFTLTGWEARFEVALSSQGTVTFAYDTTTGVQLVIDVDQVVNRGGITLDFVPGDIATPTPAAAPLWYRLRIRHPTLAPQGRTVRYGHFIVDDT